MYGVKQTVWNKARSGRSFLKLSCGGLNNKNLSAQNNLIAQNSLHVCRSTSDTISQYSIHLIVKNQLGTGGVLERDWGGTGVGLGGFRGWRRRCLQLLPRALPGRLPQGGHPLKWEPWEGDKVKIKNFSNAADR